MPLRVLEILAATPGKLRDEIAGMSLAELKKPPKPDKWSIQIILAHLNDLEDFYRRNRIGAILERTAPQLIPFNQEERAVALRYDRADPFRTFGEFARRRRANLRLLRRVNSPQWKRVGIHPQAGKISLEELVTEFAFHDLRHLRQIMEVKCYALYPKMGNMQQFYKLG